MEGKEEKAFEAFCHRVGRRVKSLRKERGWTQEYMAELGFSTRRYQRIEAGNPITLRTAYRLARAFEIGVEELFQGTTGTAHTTKRKRRH